MTACASGIRRRLGATRASIATLLIGVVLGVGTGTALPAATPPAGTANNEVKETANTKAAPTESDSSDASSEDAHGLAMAAIDSAKAGFAARMNDVAKAPAEIARLKAAAGSTLLTGEGVRSLTYLLILILVGCAAEWLYWTYAASPLRLLLAVQPESRRHALGLGLRRGTLIGTGIVLFAVATVATSAAFDWPAGVHAAVVAATLVIVTLRLVWMCVSILLVPGPAHAAPHRLVPVTQEGVRWLAIASVVMAFITACGIWIPDWLARFAAAPHAAGALRLLTVTALLALLVITLLLYSGPTRSQPDAEPTRRRPRLPRFPRPLVVAILALGTYLLWLLGATMAAALAAIVTEVIALQLGLRDWVFFFWEAELTALARSGQPAAASQAPAHDITDASTTADSSDDSDAPSHPQPRRGLLANDPGLAPTIALSLARFVVVLLGLGAGALVLNAPMAEMARSQHVLVRIGLELLGVAALALLTHVVWIIVRTSIDHQLERIGPVDVHAEPNPKARLLTLLPLLRTTAAVLLVSMLVLTSLWALGIEVTPLLAGAGVIGLALGFGAQALVRDIIAGIFFLAEDAFRVGEYIEAGSTTKGTVERITLRTVALRHHNGPLHFVPYGSLGTVRNNSRDWVIEKFNIPLPIDVDSEKVRKTIKKIGIAMLDDPEVGHMLREPLKGKLYRIDPGVKIFRCKFETAPGNQFDVRAQAYKRIEAELKALGIGFADGVQKLIVDPGASPG